MSKPKNIRNNNPLNIKESADWKGERLVNFDPVMEEFTKPEYGFRAGYVILLQYLERGQNTIETIIAGIDNENGWAPRHVDNNDTDEYIEYVADKMKLSEFEEIEPYQLPEIMLYMSEFEGSQGVFTYAQSLTGVEMAHEESFVLARLERLGYQVRVA